MNIDEILLKNSNWTWDKLREARKVGYQLGEESITDFLILNLKSPAKNNLVVKSFTRHAEALNGADWEWWFTGPTQKWVGMRVQAKVINLAKEEYQHFDHSNKNGNQVDLLIQNARNKNMIPIYCLYTNWDPSKYHHPSNCNTYKKSIRQYGTALLSAQYVHTTIVPKKIKKLSAIIHELKPIHCMFCSCFSGNDLPMKVLHYAKSNNFIDSKSSSEYDFYLIDNPPSYVTDILNDKIEKCSLDINDEYLKTITIFKEDERQPY